MALSRWLCPRRQRTSTRSCVQSIELRGVADAVQWIAMRKDLSVKPVQEPPQRTPEQKTADSFATCPSHIGALAQVDKRRSDKRPPARDLARACRRYVQPDR